jgi:CheY-like chemotaxis protein
MMEAVVPSPLRVLCVDDNHDSADSMAMLLDMLGCEVEVSYGGTAALALAEQFRPDVCLLDLTMPGMDGLELARRLRQRACGRRMLLVAMTALGGEAHHRQTAAAGFDLHLVKPIEIDALTAALRRFAGGGSRPHRVPDAVRTGS